MLGQAYAKSHDRPSSLDLRGDAGQWPKLRKMGCGTTRKSLNVDVTTVGNQMVRDSQARSIAALPLRLTRRDRSSKVTELVS